MQNVVTHLGYRHELSPPSTLRAAGIGGCTHHKALEKIGEALVSSCLFGGMSIPDEAAALVFNASLDVPAAAIFKAENESPLFSQGGQLQVNV